MKHRHDMRFGAALADHGRGARFRLWAPGAESVALELVDGAGRSVRDPVPMAAQPDGFHECSVPDLRPGVLYRYRVAPDLAVPDPASRFNPLDVHGPSELIDPHAYRWHDGGWHGLPWRAAVVYELHVGSFTPQGSFAAAAAKLPHLQALGVNTVELMPVADFPGGRNWGYDGVLPFAPDAAYGRPDDLKAFVDTAHGLGMMVLLDVVYNHFGPDGNYLHAYCAPFFDGRRHTPWGPAINLDAADSHTVRRFFVDNALYWVDEYRVDGLRLDAVHAMQDGSGRHLVAEIAAALRNGPGRDRRVHLVLENDDNTARWLLRDAAGAPLVASAQWNDDLHHAAHVLATGETDGYYADYAGQPARHLGCALAAGFVYQGQPSGLRGGRPRGEPSALLPSQAFVSFLQNHDQIGNRALGQRLDALAPTALVEALLAALLLSPHVPMLFMGEEFAATTPFLYFCDFHGELGEAVSQGRRDEFKRFAAFADPRARATIPDPNDAATFAASVLHWEECEAPSGRRRLALVSRLLALRREHLLPHLASQRHGGHLVDSGERWFAVEWPLGDALVWCLRANLGAEPLEWHRVGPGERTLYAGDPTTVVNDRQLLLPPWSVQVAMRPGERR